MEQAKKRKGTRFKQEVAKLNEAKELVFARPREFKAPSAGREAPLNPKIPKRIVVIFQLINKKINLANDYQSSDSLSHGKQISHVIRAEPWGNPGVPPLPQLNLPGNLMFAPCPFLLFPALRTFLRFF